MSNDPSAGIIALLVVGLLVLVLRWVWSSKQPRRAPLIDAAASPHLGLLSVIAPKQTRADALRTRATLTEAGIRSSLSKRSDGRVDVLVFASDVDRARLLLDA
ncbi:MAG: hypothetical protein ACTHMS_11175 [Jatrophihabitans sp.]|uniref:hypothetical protein n=1 Tax=Jatrophihabitans sp. TaxID=1932789 RepID=UPI003F7E144F